MKKLLACVLTVCLLFTSAVGVVESVLMPDTYVDPNSADSGDQYTQIHENEYETQLLGEGAPVEGEESIDGMEGQYVDGEEQIDGMEGPYVEGEEPTQGTEDVSVEGEESVEGIEAPYVEDEEPTDDGNPSVEDEAFLTVVSDPIFQQEDTAFFDDDTPFVPHITDDEINEDLIVDFIIDTQPQDDEQTLPEATPAEPANPSEPIIESATPTEIADDTENEEIPQATVDEPQNPVLDATASEPIIATDSEPDQATESEPDQATPSEATPDEAEIVYINIRKAPSGMSEIIYIITSDIWVKVLGYEGDWAYVEVRGLLGYIYKSDLKKVENVSYQLQDEEVDEPEDEADEPEVDVQPEEDDKPKMKVTIFTSRKTVVQPGETIYLTSELIGFDNYEIKYQWQVNTGSGFVDISGANADTYCYQASIETLAYDWRLMVYYR